MIYPCFSVHRSRQIVPAGKLSEVLELAVSRAKNKCSCCEIGIPKSVGLAYKDSNPNNLKEDNVFAVCKICEALFKGGKLNADSQYGVMIYLPQMSQVEVIRLSHALYNLERMGRNTALLVNKKENFKSLRKITEKLNGTCDVDAFSEVLKNMKKQAYELRSVGLGGLRFWPDVEVFKSHLRNYSESFLDEVDLDSYISTKFK
ncbi:MAG: hypothetical protein RPS47_04550 [Colwellia sp.]|jgi:hypothetical protein